MGASLGELESVFRNELTRSASDPARRLAEELQRRHGDAVAAVLFYGSCLRKQTAEGVLDFYVIVDDYRRAYASRALAFANALYPPNVFYAQLDAADAEGPAGTLRCKYAVLTIDDFRTGAGRGTIRSSIWARFCQPAIAAWARDPEAIDVVTRVAARSALTALETLLPLLPTGSDGTESTRGDSMRFRMEDFWQTALRETYAAETRTESEETIASLYRSDPERFDRVGRLALDRLASEGRMAVRQETTDGEWIRVEWPAGSVRRAQRRWALRKPLAKVAYFCQLFKTAFTFGDWLPYALWKLERHGGTPLVPSERQRRHPLLFGWPLLARALWRRDLR